jgi:protein required for attachment to host cells
METTQNMEHPQQQDFQNQGESENTRANYTPAGEQDDDKPEQEKSDLQNTDSDEEEISGDLAGNASGNEDAEEQ